MSVQFDLYNTLCNISVTRVAMPPLRLDLKAFALGSKSGPTAIRTRVAGSASRRDIQATL